MDQIKEGPKRIISVTMRLTSERYAVNGKSILGIFSLDLSRPVTLELDENTAYLE